MEVNCAGCAGCCIDWRALVSDPVAHERQGDRAPIDDTYNLVPLRGHEARSLVDCGYGDAMTPRLFEAGPDDDCVRVDGFDLAAIGDRPVFYLGLRKPPKPVAPFGEHRQWLRSCAFLDPETLQCRIHGDDLYPETCSVYPGDNLHMDQETECERVEDVFGGIRLIDATPPDNRSQPQFAGAVGSKIFGYPDPDELSGVVDRLAANALTAYDRSLFVGIASGSSPGMLDINKAIAETYQSKAHSAESWVGKTIEHWEKRADAAGTRAVVDNPAIYETDHGAPETTGWNP
ncbi:YkgJ family cysteine cluster protein [Halorubraceae archaeon YAN]|nr:YkgJ family cysteine cluster protein [Halorubraceae archaeon YAN]